MTKKRFIKLFRAERASERALREVVRFVQYWRGALSYERAYKILYLTAIIAELPLDTFYDYCIAQIMDNWENWERNNK